MSSPALAVALVVILTPIASGLFGYVLIHSLRFLDEAAPIHPRKDDR